MVSLISRLLCEMEFYVISVKYEVPCYGRKSMAEKQWLSQDFEIVGGGGEAKPTNKKKKINK